MGQTLSEPITEKHSRTGGNHLQKYGVSEMQGWRASMEDANTAILGLDNDKEISFFAVYDGHGGKSAAQFCQQNYHKIFLEELKTVNELTTQNVQAATKAAYFKCDNVMKETVPYPGSCAVTAFLSKHADKKLLHVANAGDSRAVLHRNGVAERLSEDHKCTNPKEAQRILEISGAFIKDDRVNGLIAVTRAFGDHNMKSGADYLLIEPHCVSVELLPTDKFLILACDGVWDVMSDQEAIDLIKDIPDAATMAKTLVIHSLKQGSKDNLSVIVVIF